MKHWDLTPRQSVTLIRQSDGHKLSATFLFRDTVRACFQILDDEQCGELRQFQLLEDGGLKDSPTREQLLRSAMYEPAGSSSAYHSPSSFERALMNCKRWTIERAPVLSF